jgi:hypothetical protein
MAASDVSSVSSSGVWVTAIWRAAAAFKSILSRPTPPDAINLRSGKASIKAALAPE